MSFWGCGKFPVVDVTFISTKDVIMKSIRLCINGCYAGYFNDGYSCWWEDVFLFDLRRLRWEDKWPISATFPVSGRNHVEVKCEHSFYSWNDVNRVSMASYCGVWSLCVQARNKHGGYPIHMSRFIEENTING